MIDDETRVRDWMRWNAGDHTTGGEINMTRLAEAAVDELGLDQRLLDDPDSRIWELALEVAEGLGGLR